MDNKDAVLTKIQSSALDAMGIVELNAMQCGTLEQFRKGGDVGLLSPTGSGKTLAYLLSLLDALDGSLSAVQAVVILPTRELARQVADVWKSMNTGIRAVCLHGGRSVGEELSLFKTSSPALVSSTPGRFNDHVSRGTFGVENIKLLVLDEFDKSLELGFKEEMEQLQGSLPLVERCMLLSATDSDEFTRFVNVDDYAKLDYTAEADKPQQRTAFYFVKTTQNERLNALASLLCLLRGESAIVFCNFREMVDEVYAFLRKKGIAVIAYHGGLEQKQRELSLYKFKSGCATVLVCTDLASRGLDIPDVKHVVHYQRPVNEESYIHRNGRTARWDADGAVYLFSFENKPLPEFAPDDLNEYILPKRNVLPPNPEWTILYVGKGRRDKISRGDLAGFFMKKGGLRSDELGTILVFDNYSYVAVKLNRMRAVIKAVEGEKIKGVKTIVQPLRMR